MENNRLERLENKVDQLKDDVSELKTDFKVHVARMDQRLDRFADHIEGDNKIINHIEPLLNQLPIITKLIEDFQYSEQSKARRNERIKTITLKLTLVSVTIAIIGGVLKFFS